MELNHSFVFLHLTTTGELTKRICVYFQEVLQQLCMMLRIVNLQIRTQLNTMLCLMKIKLNLLFIFDRLKQIRYKGVLFSLQMINKVGAKNVILPMAQQMEHF
jgi:hypothetical protein